MNLSVYFPNWYYREFMKILVAQLNSIIGDLQGNTEIESNEEQADQGQIDACHSPVGCRLHDRCRRHCPTMAERIR